MFAGLLERRSATSLLARRQVTQDKLRALREEGGIGIGVQEDAQRSRRQNSEPRDLPPVPPLHLESLQVSRSEHPGSRVRSNTSPAAMDTPSKERFADPFQHEGEISHPSHIVRLASVKGSSPMSTGRPSFTSNRPQLISKFHKQSPIHEPSGSKSTINSSIDLSEKESEQGGLSPPPGLAHAHNSAITTSPGSQYMKQSSPPSSQQTTRSTRHTASTSDAQGSLSLSSLSEEELDKEQEKAMQDAVQVSIARQISVSREQRRMLGPLQMHPIEGRRLAETKSSRPRLVDPKKDPSSPSAGYRKSERVVLEGL
jgi:hypothetical protein